jgi:hypothetical protein
VRKEKVGLHQGRVKAGEREATVQREAAKEGKADLAQEAVKKEGLMRMAMAQGHLEEDGENQETSLRLERFIESGKNS